MKSSCCGGVTTPALSLSGAGTVCPVPVPPLPAVNQSVFIKGKGAKGDPGDPGPPGLDGVDGTDGEDGEDAELPPGLVEAQGKLVMTWAELVAACAAGERYIQLANDLTSESNLDVLHGVNVNILPFRIIQGGAHTFRWFGSLSPNRTQVFEGFTAGQIKGTFGTGYVIPEWWGLIGTNLATYEHDVAVNCAIRCAEGSGGQAVVVSLGARQYYIKRPLDLRGTSSRLVGVSSSATMILGTATWDPGIWEGGYYVGITHKPYTHAAVVSVTGNGDGTSTLVVAAGGTTEMIVGEKVRITGGGVPAYNAQDWEVTAVMDHQTVRIMMPYTSAPTGAFIDPVTIDGDMESGANCASAGIWIGGDVTDQDYFTAVERLGINMYAATEAHPQKRVSCISWTEWVQEQTILYDVGVAGFSGYGIGGENPSGITVVNGLTIEKFWAGQGTRRFAAPIFIPSNSICFSVRDGTIDMTFSQNESVIGPNAYKRIPPQYGILAAGAHTTIENLHFESVNNGIHVYDTGRGGSVKILGCTFLQMLDFSQRWTTDDARRKWAIPDFLAEIALDNLSGTNPYIFHNGTCVSIGAMAQGYEAGVNKDMPVTVENIIPMGGTRYTLLDFIMGVWEDPWGGRFPFSRGRSIGFYSRGIPSMEPIKGRWTASADSPANPGVWTRLTVPDSSGFTLNAYGYFYPDLKEHAAYANQLIVRGKPDATHIDIENPVSSPGVPIPYPGGTFAGTTWYSPGRYDFSAPQTDKLYKIGPLW